MTTLRRRLLLAPAALAALALGACSSPYGSSSAAAPPATTTTIQGADTPAQTRVATFRAALTYLLVEHAYLLAASIPTDTSMAPTQLAANGTDLASLLGQPYGQDFGTQFLQLWTSRNTDIESYARAKATKDVSAATAATTQLATDVASLADLFHTNNKFLAVHTVSNPATGIGDELTNDDTAFIAWVDTAATADPTAVSKLVTAAEAMPHTADVLAAATAKLYPSVYPGTATGTAANLRASITAMLVEHLELASNTAALIASGQDAGPQQVALNANSVQLHNAFASIYDDNVAASFSTLWGHMVDELGAYAKAAASRDAPGEQAADAQLGSFATDFGQFIATTTGKIDAATVTEEMQAQIADLQAVVKGAALTSPDIFLAVRRAVAHGPTVAATLSEALAERMPARYLP